MANGELGRIYSDGEEVFKEGDRGEVMYVVQSGTVRITKNTKDGELILTELGNGEIFGEMALFDRLPRSANAKAAGEARVLSIDKKKLFSTISVDPTLVFKIVESMSGRMRRVNEELTKLKKYRTGMRGFIDLDMIAEMVLEEARHVISADNGSVMLIEDDALCIKAAFGTKSVRNMRFSKGEGVAGQVLDSGRAELVNNVSLDSRFIRGGADIHSLICVPLKSQDRPIGVINMSNASEKLFTLEELKLLRAISVYASISIQNAINFVSLQRVADDVLKNMAMLDIV